MPFSLGAEARARERGLLPGYVTADLAGIGGTLRKELTDFVVEEIPLYEPSGSGQHTLFGIEKRGLSTLEAVTRLASALRVPRRLLSSAGLKDARAVARQTLSVEGVSPQSVLSVQVPNVDILWAERHRNRLKIGHLKGNCFTIRIRDVEAASLPQAERILTALGRRGVPNGFGYQRFGGRQTSHLLGQAMLRHDLDLFFGIYLGRPQSGDPQEMRQARRLYDAGAPSEALGVWRPISSAEHQALAHLAEGQSLEAACDQVPRSLKRLFVSAYQSFLFNRLVDDRLGSLGQLEEGDLAIKHENGAFFLVQDPAREQPRADLLEISPSAPLYGYKTRLADGAPGRRERDQLESAGLTPETWRLGGGLRMAGDRRPLRVPLGDWQIAYEDGVVVRFALPAGAYASNVLAEITKGQID